MGHTKAYIGVCEVSHTYLLGCLRYYSIVVHTAIISLHIHIYIYLPTTVTIATT